MAGTSLKRIGIDARMYGLEHAGIGRYVMNLVDHLLPDDSIHWVIFCSPAYEAHFKTFRNAEAVPVSVRHYSLAEQLQWVSILNAARLDLLHVPHFNVPLMYKGPLVVTIHDILWHHVQGGMVTTLPPWLYYLKYQGYRWVVSHAVTSSRAIFAPSEYVKQDLLKTFPSLDQAKIMVTYEGVSEMKPGKVNSTQHPYVLYVGSAYPHKNIPVIFKALESLPDMNLIIVGSRSVFLNKLKRQLKAHQLKQIAFVGPVSDEQLAELYLNAVCLIHPSKSEGFGLTGLEAMSAGCPVIAANSSCLPEIYGEASLFFEPDDWQQLTDRIKRLIDDHKFREMLIQKGREHAKKYSWDKMVSETLAVYKKLL